MFFTSCHTPEELKDSYRYWAKKLHPDKGGDPADFRKMNEEYNDTLRTIGYQHQRNTMPRLFDTKGTYEYYRRSVKYVGVHYNHYYKFVQLAGADIFIDLDHINLIYTGNKRLQY